MSCGSLSPSPYGFNAGLMRRDTITAMRKHVMPIVPGPCLLEIVGSSRFIHLSEPRDHR